jgi:hypothetical protein
MFKLVLNILQLHVGNLQGILVSVCLFVSAADIEFGRLLLLECPVEEDREGLEVLRPEKTGLFRYVLTIALTEQNNFLVEMLYFSVTYSGEPKVAEL